MKVKDKYISRDLYNYIKTEELSTQEEVEEVLEALKERIELDLTVEEEIKEKVLKKVAKSLNETKETNKTEEIYLHIVKTHLELLKHLKYETRLKYKDEVIRIANEEGYVDHKGNIISVGQYKNIKGASVPYNYRANYIGYLDYVGQILSLEERIAYYKEYKPKDYAVETIEEQRVVLNAGYFTPDLVKYLTKLESKDEIKMLESYNLELLEKYQSVLSREASIYVLSRYLPTDMFKIIKKLDPGVYEFYLDKGYMSRGLPRDVDKKYTYVYGVLNKEEYFSTSDKDYGDAYTTKRVVEHLFYE